MISQHFSEQAALAFRFCPAFVALRFRSIWRPVKSSGGRWSGQEVPERRDSSELRVSGEEFSVPIEVDGRGASLIGMFQHGTRIFRNFFAIEEIFSGGAAFCGADAGFCGRIWLFGGAVFSFPGRREAASSLFQGRAALPPGSRPLPRLQGGQGARVWSRRAWCRSAMIWGPAGRRLSREAGPGEESRR